MLSSTFSPFTSIVPEAFATSPPSARRIVLVPEPTCPARPGDDPALERQRDAVDAAGHGQPLDPDNRFARAGHGVLVLRHRLHALHLAEHLLDQGAPIDLVDLVRRDVHSVAQHRHAVAELEDLVEPVRDEDDAPPLRDEVARRTEHALDLGLAERCRRLVQDQQPRVADEQARDLDELPLSDRERLDGGAELDVAEAELVEDAACVLSDRRRRR